MSTFKNGLLGKATSTNDGVSYVTPVSIPTDANIDFVTLSIICVNTESIDVEISVAVCPDTTTVPSIADFVDYKTIVPGHGSLERTCLVVSPGEKIMITSTSRTSGTGYRVYGLVKEL